MIDPFIGHGTPADTGRLRNRYRVDDRRNERELHVRDDARSTRMDGGANSSSDRRRSKKGKDAFRPILVQAEQPKPFCYTRIIERLNCGTRVEYFDPTGLQRRIVISNRELRIEDRPQPTEEKATS